MSGFGNASPPGLQQYLSGIKAKQAMQHNTPPLPGSSPESAKAVLSPMQRTPTQQAATQQVGTQQAATQQGVVQHTPHKSQPTTHKLQPAVRSSAQQEMQQAACSIFQQPFQSMLQAHSGIVVAIGPLPSHWEEERISKTLELSGFVACDDFEVVVSSCGFLADANCGIWLVRFPSKSCARALRSFLASSSAGGIWPTNCKAAVLPDAFAAKLLPANSDTWTSSPSQGHQAKQKLVLSKLSLANPIATAPLGAGPPGLGA